MTAPTPPDPVRARRARIARWVALGSRLGYGLFLLAIVVFVVGAVGRFTGGLTSLIALCLALGSLVLLPAIIFGYAVRAAEREDRERGV